MGLLNSADLAAMRSDLLAVRGDNPVSVVIRRGNTTLTAQTVRVSTRGRMTAQRRTGQGATETTNLITVLGDIGLNIQPDDRFTLSGILYRVTFVHPNRRVRIEAQATAVE